MSIVARTDRHAGVIEVFDKAIPNCADILRVINNTANWNDARVGGGGGEVDGSVRNNQVAFYNPFDFSVPMTIYGMFRQVWEYIDDYASRYGVGFAGMENVNVNRYFPGQSYNPHADDGPGHNRVISALLYLNDVDEGGETEFTFFDVSVKPQAGRLIIFPSNYAYTHAAHPPVSGVKYSAAFWTERL